MIFLDFDSFLCSFTNYSKWKVSYASFGTTLELAKLWQTIKLFGGGEMHKSETLANFVANQRVIIRGYPPVDAKINHDQFKRWHSSCFNLQKDCDQWKCFPLYHYRNKIQ